MLPDDPNQQPGDPEETSPELTQPDYSTRRIEPQDLEPPAASELPAPRDYATRKLESDQPETGEFSTRRINPDELFSALEPPAIPPAAPAEPTRVIDEPPGAALVFSLPDTPPQAETPPAPEAPRASGFSLPPTPETPPPGGFTLPPDPVPPAGAPPAKKDNTVMWIAGIAAVVVLVLCCLCACTIIALTAIGSGNGLNF